MSEKSKIIFYIVVLVGLFALGRYSAPETVKIEKQVIEVEKKTKDKETNKKNNKIYIKVETILPDGTRRIETKIVDKGTITIDATETSENEKETKEEKTVSKTRPVIVYGGGGVNLLGNSTGPEFTAGVQKSILGPIYLGGYGTSKGTLGVTIGLGL